MFYISHSTTILSEAHDGYNQVHNPRKPHEEVFIFHKYDSRRQLTSVATTCSHWLAAEDDQFSLDQVPDLKGKVAVVTGGPFHV